MKRSVLLTLVLTLLRVTTGLAQAPYDVPEGSVQFEPLPVYREWAEEVWACAGVEGDFDSLSFWAVPAPFGFMIYGGGPFAGFYDPKPDPDRVYVMSYDREDEGLVKHELLHIIGPEPGVDGEPEWHPSPPYDVCAPRWYFYQPWKR